ncbi:MAG TPA: type II secretion system F family protein [Stellaceae bacterium]|nr:type II secretion system F family protein [Stellaceae bacterium]
MPIIIVYVVVVLAIFTLLQAILLAFPASQKGDAVSLRRKTLADGVGPWLGELAHDFENLVLISGSGWSPTVWLCAMAGTTAFVMLLVYFLLAAAPLLALLAGIVAGVLLPLLVLTMLRRRRLAKLALQLPDALDMLVRSLRVGHPIPIGIEGVANEMPNPIGGEFRRVFDSMAYGLDLKDALEHMSDRLRVPEVRYMVAAIRIQYATGGNLADVLASLAEVMRERVRLKAKVRAITAETRLSGNIMSVMPFVLVGGMFWLRPELYEDVPKSVALQIIMGAAAALLAIGIVLMRRIVNIRV